MKTEKSIRFTPVLAAAAALAAAATFVVGVVGTATAGPRSGPASDLQAQRLREIERTRLRALVEADLVVAGPLHAAEFRVTPPHGFPSARDEYLAAVAAGDIDYLVFEPISEIDVRLYGKAAVLIYRSNIDIVVSGLGRFTHEAWHTYVYEKHHGRWQAVWEQATAIGGFPPAGADGPASGLNHDVLPGDTAVPFWPHETGALAGTSETFVDMRADGSYLDLSLGRRVWP